jgi:mRNA-degrading endonuclease RelE of RelBE toxin-antitoxin system
MSKNPRHQWKIFPNPRISKNLSALSKEARQGVFRVLRILLESDDPYRVPGVRKMEGIFSRYHRARAGDYRIMYRIELLNPRKDTKGGLSLLKSTIGRIFTESTARMIYPCLPVAPPAKLKSSFFSQGDAPHRPYNHLLRYEKNSAAYPADSRDYRLYALQR